MEAQSQDVSLVWGLCWLPSAPGPMESRPFPAYHPPPPQQEASRVCDLSSHLTSHALCRTLVLSS